MAFYLFLFVAVCTSTHVLPHNVKFPDKMFCIVIFIVAPCILKSKVSHLPTDALFITLGNV
jgi:hypothetical protein